MYCKPAIATISLGQAGLHDIRDKLREAAACGLGGIELFYDDLEALARLLSTDTCSIVRPPSRHNIQEAARTIRDLCDDLHLVILNLQPFRFYEGLVDRAETARLQEQVLPLWLEIIQILGTSTILVASNFLGPDPVTGKARTHSGRLDVIVDDLRDMADRAALCSPPVRIAYEAIAWGNEINKWEQAWEVVQLVDRPNFGLALDTFNMAAAVFADPTTETGMIEDSAASAQSGMQATLHRMATELDMTKVFVVQIADGERLAEPLRSGHPFYVAGQPPPDELVAQRPALPVRARARLLPSRRRRGAATGGAAGLAGVVVLRGVLQDIGRPEPRDTSHTRGAGCQVMAESDSCN
ncbi:41 kDa peptidyl-prolyl cis-trans isomerase [Apiospora arundinis]